MNYLDFQLLLYVPQERYEACRAFYEQVFAVQPFYGWDEGPEDRGVKYDLAGAKLVLLTQEDPFPTYGAVHFQLEVPSLEDIFRRRTGRRRRDAGTLFPPLRLAHVPHEGPRRQPHQHLHRAAVHPLTARRNPSGLFEVPRGFTIYVRLTASLPPAWPGSGRQ